MAVVMEVGGVVREKSYSRDAISNVDNDRPIGVLINLESIQDLAAVAQNLLMLKMTHILLQCTIPTI
jgi:hypothetical protein